MRAAWRCEVRECLDYPFTRTAEGEATLLTMYAKANTGNMSTAKLKEIRRDLDK